MKKLFYFLLMIAISVAACKKGDTGPAGKDGTNGTNGTNGKNGNANVKSYIITEKPADWTALVFGSCNAYPKLAAITDSVFNYGTVLLYYKNGDTNWANLPIIGYNYGFSKNTTTGNYIWINHETTIPTSDVVFRAVVIPASVSAINVKNLPFDYIKEKFELKE